jgi:signal transduction histidine kinase
MAWEYPRSFPWRSFSAFEGSRLKQSGLFEGRPATEGQERAAQDASRLRFSAGRYVLGVGALTALYVALERVSSIHDYKGLPFTAWDPGLGLCFALLIVRPALAAPGLFFGIVIAEALVLHGALSWPAVAAFALIVAGCYGAAAHAVRGTAGFDPALHDLRDVAILLAGGLAAAIASGFLLLILLISIGNLAVADIGPAAWPHIVGDTIGIAVVSPLVLSFWTLRPGWRMGGFEAIWPELACFLLASAVFASLLIGAPTRESLQYLYILVAPVMIAAVRHGLLGASVSLAATQAVLIAILGGVGIESPNFTAYQTFMLGLTSTGLLVGAIVSERDATRRRTQAMEREAARAARFNLVSGMAAALAHEIGQPLTAARARARTIERLIELNDIPRATEQLAPLVAQIDRAAEILQRMREFLRRGEMERKPVAWEEIANRAATLLAPVAREKNVRIEWSSEEALPPILCDPIQIEQVVVNLAVNALEALSASSESDRRLRIAARVADRMLEVVAQDNGPGIDPDIAASLFDAMTTTRQDGLGLGLAICASILEFHHGRLWLEASRRGHTEFRFRIPFGSS